MIGNYRCKRLIDGIDDRINFIERKHQEDNDFVQGKLAAFKLSKKMIESALRDAIDTNEYQCFDNFKIIEELGEIKNNQPGNVLKVVIASFEGDVPAPYIVSEHQISRYLKEKTYRKITFVKEEEIDNLIGLLKQCKEKMSAIKQEEAA